MKFIDLESSVRLCLSYLQYSPSPKNHIRKGIEQARSESPKFCKLVDWDYPKAFYKGQNMPQKSSQSCEIFNQAQFQDPSRNIKALKNLKLEDFYKSDSL